MGLDARDSLLLVISIANIALGFLILLKDRKNIINQTFGGFALSIAFWSFTIFAFRAVSDENLAFTAMKLAYVSAVFIAAFFWIFAVAFPGEKIPKQRTQLALLAMAFTLTVLIFIPPFLTREIVYHPWGRSFNLGVPEYIIYTIYFMSFFFGGLFVVGKKLFKARGRERRHLSYIFWSVLIAGSGGVTFNLFLPSPIFNEWRFIWIGPIFTFIIVLFITYAIARYQILNIRVIAAQLLTIAVILIFLFQVLFASSFWDLILRLLFLILVSFFGSLLIKSVSQEVKRREEQQNLAERLRVTNEELAERNLFLNALQDITGLITKTLDFRKVTQEIVDGIQSKLHYQGGMMMLLSEDLKRLHPVAYSKTRFTNKVLKLLPKDPFEYYGDFEKDETLSIRAIKDGQIQVADRLSRFVSPPIPKKIADLVQEMVRIKTVVAVPVFSEDTIIGVIDFLLDKPKEKIRLPEFQTMQALANQAGIVTRNLILYQQIQEANLRLAVANEKLKELDQAKSEFISIASHQLRSPLTIIKGYTSLILEGQYGKTSRLVKDTIIKIFDSTNRLITLVNDLLNISRIETGKMVYNFKLIDLDGLVKGVVDELMLNALKKKLKMSYQGSAKLVRVKADGDKLRQVIVNLVDNAIKYTQKGSIKVSLTKLDRTALFEVVDTGIGFDKKDHKKLFEKFSRGSKMVTTIEGSGLGLFVGRKIIEAHAGKIGAESKGRGKGSRFYFTLNTE